MPVTAFKNNLYRLALPFAGLRINGHAECLEKVQNIDLNRLESIFRRHHVVGACLQLVANGLPGPMVTYGIKRLPDEPVSKNSIFRAASITKMVTAAGFLNLAEQGAADLSAPVEAYFDYPVRNPHFPKSPILVKHLLSHTSGIWDGPGYAKALSSPIQLKALLSDKSNYLPYAPGDVFRYSNLAAGMVGSIMERVTGLSLEDLMKRHIFSPLKMNATYTLRNINDISETACIYRVLPKRNGEPLYDPLKRLEMADDMAAPSPETCYLAAAGNLLTDAVSLGRFAASLSGGGSPVLSKESIIKMQTPFAAYGKHAPFAMHCLGLVAVDDPGLNTGRIYGHQGFAYGAAQSVFYQESSKKGFVFLNSGASEARKGHLALVNQDLIRFLLDT